MKYHINNRDEVKPCSAQNKCRFGSTTEHYTSFEKAQKVAEQRLETKFPVQGLKKKNNLNRLSSTKMKNRTKSSAYSFASKGMELRIGTIDEIKESESSESNVDILSDSDQNDQELLAKIQAGKVKAFT